MVYVRFGSRYFQSFRVLVCVLVLVLYPVWFEICVVLYLWCWCVCWCVGLSICVVWFEIFSKFESVGVCVATCSIFCVVRDMCGVVSVVLVCWFEYMCGLVRDIFKV